MPITEDDKLQAYECVKITLEGLMKMVLVEVETGSNAWSKVPELINDALVDLEALRP